MRQQRVTAQREKIVAGSHAFGAKELGPDRGQFGFDARPVATSFHAFGQNGADGLCSSQERNSLQPTRTV